jgi:hypothetical protein
MFSLSYYLYSVGILGVWIFILDIPDLVSSIKEIIEKVRG